MRERRMSVADTVIRGGLVVDGTGAAPFVGDVAFKDGKVSAVGECVARYVGCS